MLDRVDVVGNVCIGWVNFDKEYVCTVGRNSDYEDDDDERKKCFRIGIRVGETRQ